MTPQDIYGQKNVQKHLNILKESGFEINPDSGKILDFGCGAGREVYQFRKMGYKAYGCDIINLSGNIQNRCKEEGLIGADETIFRSIDMANYRIPFPRETFDYVFSNQVFEHVQNYPEALSEIYRVLKPGGCSMHFFPARYRPLEGHVFVPFGGIFQGYKYLAFWAFLGIRNSYQKGFSFKKTARVNFEYLNNCTTYFTKAEISKHVFNQFQNVSFLEKYFIKHGDGSLKHLHWLNTKFPFIADLVRTFHTRVLFFRKFPEKHLPHLQTEEAMIPEAENQVLQPL